MLHKDWGEQSETGALLWLDASEQEKVVRALQLQIIKRCIKAWTSVQFVRRKKR